MCLATGFLFFLCIFTKHGNREIEYGLFYIFLMNTYQILIPVTVIKSPTREKAPHVKTKQDTGKRWLLVHKELPCSILKY